MWGRYRQTPHVTLKDVKCLQTPSTDYRNLNQLILPLGPYYQIMYAVTGNDVYKICLITKSDCT